MVGSVEGIDDAGRSANYLGEIELAVVYPDGDVDYAVTIDFVLVDWGNIGGLISDINNEARCYIGGVELHERSVENREPRDVELLEAYLSDPFVSCSRHQRLNGEHEGVFVLSSSKLEADEKDVTPRVHSYKIEVIRSINDVPLTISLQLEPIA